MPKDTSRPVHTYSEKTRYRPEIDGLRAVAVLPVILYHAEIAGWSGGFVGVDVFFVISGFLITGIIAAEIAERRFSFARFYERRARRILPALLLVMLFCVPVAFLTMAPYQLEDFAQSVFAVIFFASNFLFWQEADYFAAEAAGKPLLHTWSLAVEEQFYLVLPILLIFLLRRGLKGTWVTLLVLAALSFALVQVYGRTASAANFYLFPSRAWELLAGSLCVLMVQYSNVRPNAVLAWLGLALVGASFAVADPLEAWPSTVTILPVAGTALLLMFSETEHGAGRVLALRPVVAVGLISYSLYLWHVPLLTFARIHYFGDPPAWVIGAAVVLTVVLSVATWALVEQPCRKRGVVPILPFSGTVVALCAGLAVFGYAGHTSSGFYRYKLEQLPPELATLAIDRQTEVDARLPKWKKALAGAEEPFVQDGGRRVLILGDSLSGDLFVATGGHADKFPGYQFRRVRLDDRCMPEMLSALQAGSYDASAKEGCAREVARMLSSGLLDSADEIVLAANWQRETADDGIALAQKLAGPGRDVAILGVAAFNDFASLSMRLGQIEEPLGRFLFSNIRSKFIGVNATLRDGMSGGDSLRFLDKLALYCDQTAQSCEMTDENGRLILYDSAHTTAPGVDVMAERIRQAGWFN